MPIQTAAIVRARAVCSAGCEKTRRPASASVSAAATLIGVLVDDGKVEEAERRLGASRKGMPTDEYQVLNRRVATGWIRAGELDRAERTLQSDSTVEGIALAGRIAIYRGDLIGGVSRLRMAGPYAGTREEATERTALLALLQPIETDTLVELGAAPSARATRFRGSSRRARTPGRQAAGGQGRRGAQAARGAYIARSGETATLSASSARLLSRKHRPPLRRRSSSWRAS